MIEGNLIIQKTIAFSNHIIQYCERLEDKKKYVIARQLLRSATSIGANVFESQNAESRLDFIHKLKIAAKEAHETMYWLILCEANKSYDFDSTLKNEIEEIIRILNKIIVSSKVNSKK
ncbi:MAG: hypothetical protein RJA07_2336 [Bacteroidota bacterium]|jgi:four helix bundle protein